MVSICMITYGHERFIEEAINGVLLQEVDFDIELIISNDNSPDNTNQIIERIIKTDPRAGRIKYFNQAQNLGVGANFEFVLTNCTGRYIALCDGDDYWTDPLKLQKQVNFMEHNMHFSICCHEVKIIDDNGVEVPSDLLKALSEDVKATKDLFYGNFIPTPSCLYRNHGPVTFPKWLKRVNILDWYLHFQNSKGGKIKILAERMAVYRKHSTSTWSPLKEEIKLKQSIVFINEINREFDYKFDTDARRTIANQLAFILQLKDIGFLSRLQNNVGYHFYNSPVGLKGKLVYFAYTFIPWVYKIYKSIAQKVR